MKLGIGIPLSHNYLSYDFFESYVAMQKPENHMLFRAGGYTGLAEMRNQLVNAAQHYDCTHLLFLDTDHKHSSDTIVKLMSYNKDIVSGLNFMRVEPFTPVMFHGKINAYHEVRSIEGRGLIEVDSVGCACMLVNMQVFKKMEKPYFKFMPNPDPTIPYGIGEDVYFCNAAKKLGYKIYVDTSLETNHIGQVICNTQLWENWKKVEKGEEND